MIQKVNGLFCASIVLAVSATTLNAETKVDDRPKPTKEKPFDAPDQCVWHPETRTWFVSNLGGGISLDKDDYGWITRLDEKGNVIDPVWVGFIENMHALKWPRVRCQ